MIAILKFTLKEVSIIGHVIHPPLLGLLYIRRAECSFATSQWESLTLEQRLNGWVQA